MRARNSARGTSAMSMFPPLAKRANSSSTASAMESERVAISALIATASWALRPVVGLTTLPLISVSKVFTPPKELRISSKAGVLTTSSSAAPANSPATRLTNCGASRATSELTSFLIPAVWKRPFDAVSFATPPRISVRFELTTPTAVPVPFTSPTVAKAVSIACRTVPAADRRMALLTAVVAVATGISEAAVPGTPP